MRAVLAVGIVVAALYTPLAEAQVATPPGSASPAAVLMGSSPEMQKVVKSLVGTWSTNQTGVQPQGTPTVTGSGTEVWYTATGGTTLIEEYHTKSAQGDAHDTGLIWWDGKARKIQGLWCADINDEGCSSFDVHWEGSDLIMAGQWERRGQRLAWKEVFGLTGPNSFTQALYIGSPGGDLKLVSVIHAKRISSADARSSPR